MDVGGLVMGIPGLFTACLECFRLVQTARSLEGDFNRLVRKYKNQELRFAAWGKACGFVDDGNNNTITIPDHLLPDINENLLCIKELFDDAKKLKSRYGLKEAPQDLRVESNRSSDRRHFSGILDRIRRWQPHTPRFTSARWAIEDNGKFEKLVADLKEFIDALEFLTKDLEVSRNQRAIVQDEIEEIEDISSLEEIAVAGAGEDDIVSDAATERLSILESSRRAGTKASSYYTAAARTETVLSAVDEYGDPSQSDVPQNRRLMSTFTRPKTEAFDASKKTAFFDEVTIIDNYKKLLDCRSWFAPSGPKRTIIRQLQSFTTPFNNRVDDRLLVVGPINGNLNDLLTTFLGPVDTPYEGGVFFVRMELPSDFPFIAPKCRFLTKIYHPNVDPSGKICLSTLEDDWTPILGLERTILGLISILSDPGLEDPLVPEIAALYMSDRDQYLENAKAYTQRYASPPFAATFSADGSCEIREQPKYGHAQQRLAHLLCQNMSMSYKLCPFQEPWIVFRDGRKRIRFSRGAAFEGALIDLDYVLYELCDLHKPWDFAKVIQHLENTAMAMKPLLEAGFSMGQLEDSQMCVLADRCQRDVEKETAELQSLVDKVS